MGEGVEEVSEVQGLLIPQRQAPLLLPSASVIEIIGYRELVRDEGDAPAWMLGRFEWRHLMLPLISMERLLGVERQQRRGRKRIIVIHVFDDRLEHPFVGVDATGMPRLVNINDASLEVEAGEAWPSDWPVLYKVKIQETEALVPDLDRLGALAASLEQAAA
ncbi:MAG TPA: chemotaxis protein CheW [Thiolapillus brandeum]|uniref:Chemotaxis protein CheW n=1 Tax=Thiolapillus brandeum TaxID=1076588 RepID=A0A7C5IZ16_9GAMM|nr:chemotaxis protein CheW [Thiolapillus brandeum]